jgi:hypothetical protein
MDETAGPNGITRLKELVDKFKPDGEFSDLPQYKEHPIVLGACPRCYYGLA